MICLTGDLHHASLKTGNQKHCPISEIQVAGRYLKLLEAAGVKVTFFISGRAFAQEWTDLRPIVESPLVEVGGHNFTCFSPELFHRVSKKLFGSYPGPRCYEEWDVRRTVAIIERCTGRRIEAWRNHMYLRGPNTDTILRRYGIKVCSDGVRAAAAGPTTTSSGVLHLPINVMPDHEHLYHAERTPEWVAWWKRRYRWSDDYGSDSYYIEEWTERVLGQLESNRREGRLSCLIIHPITMYLCDRFACFERILEEISRHQTVHVSEVLGQA